MPDIPVWSECDIHCVFCSNPLRGFRGTSERYSLDEFRRKWELYKSGRKAFLKFDGRRDFCSLTGGEPTLHPHFLRILRILRRDCPGQRIRLLTNARRLARPEFAALCLRVGGAPFDVAVPVFGRDAASHESISRAPGSFAQTMKGLENLFRYRRPGQRVEARVILHRRQLPLLGGLIDFLGARFPALDALELLFVEIEGHAEAHWKELRVTMRECVRRIDRLFPALSRLRDFRLLHFPLCVVPRRLWPKIWNTLDPIKVCFPVKCRYCAVREHCVGVHASYARHMGCAEFRPVRARPSCPVSGSAFHPFLEERA